MNGRDGSPSRSDWIRMSILTTVIQHRVESSNHGNHRRKIKWIRVGKVVKLSLLAYDMIPYQENPTCVNRKQLELINEFSKVAGYEIKYSEISCIPIH